MLLHPKKLGFLAAITSTLAMIACNGGDDTGASSADETSSLALHAEAAPLADFKFDTGLLPADSPAQVQLKLSAGGGLTIDAAADRGGNGLTGKKGGGKLALDLHVKATGRLKVDSTFKSYDGELPGLKDLDIPIASAVAFDGFLLGDGESAAATANLPETTLPKIPLGSVPGSLVITVAKGSTLTSTFHGSCVSVTGGKAAYTGESKTNGTLILKVQLVLDLPVPLNKTVDLPEITVQIPAVTTKVEGETPTAGVADSKSGACGAAPATGAAAPPTGGGAPPASSPAPKSGATCNAVKNVGPFVTSDKTKDKAPTPTGGTILDGTYELISMRSYSLDADFFGGATKRTIVVSKNTMQTINEDGASGVTSTWSGLFTTSGVVIARNFTCPTPTSDDNAGDNGTYSASATSFTLYYTTDDGLLTYSYTYGKL